MQSRILLISPFFYPEAISTGKYNTVIAQALARTGAEVSVLTSHPLYPAWKPVRSTEQLEGISITRGGALVRYPRRPVLRRLVLESWFAWHAGRTAASFIDRVDTVVAVFPPNLFFRRVDRMLPVRVKRIGILHDLQAIMGTRNARGLNSALRHGIERIEGDALRRCDFIVALSDSMAEQVNKIYGIDPARIVVCYPFVTIDTGKSLGTRLADLFPPQYAHIVYSGALGQKQDPMRLYGLLKAAAERFPNVMCHIFSEGPSVEMLKSLCASEAHGRVRFHPLVAEADLEELYARSSVQLIPQAAGMQDGCIPSKLPNLIASGVAVMAICERGCELYRLVEGAQPGACATSWNVDYILPQLEMLLRRAEAESQMVRRQRAAGFASSMFSLDRLIETLSPQRAARAVPVSVCVSDD
jgi:glycosyltransferase involved in cell wall biosynthesis